MAELYIGVSGWRYAEWRNGAFYPPDLPQRRELEYLCRQFNSVEINGSFYSLLRPHTYAAYREAAPPDFRFAVKGGRFITHNKKLKDVRTPLANFFASGVLRLEDRLGPVLWQFPPLAWDSGRVAAFLELLPDDTRSASRLAKRHDRRVSGRASMVVHENRPLHHVLEIRHESLLSEAVVRLCRQRDVAIAVADSGDWPCREELTAGLVYIRLHGSPQTYTSRYSDARLDYWAARIRSWARGRQPADARRISGLEPPSRSARDVYIYFDNDRQARAPHDAQRLMRRLKVTGPEAGRD